MGGVPEIQSGALNPMQARTFIPVFYLGFLLAISGCNTQTVRTTMVERVVAVGEPIPDDLLLDVNIAIFDPGIENLDPKRTTTTPGVRRAEGHYIAARLKQTLESAEQWGAVRVVPELGREVDVEVWGTILKSDGETLKIEASVQDAMGQHWFTRTYEEQVSRFAYDAEIRRRQEPFQNVYNRVANDMRDYLMRQDLATLRNIRTVSELRFAGRFASESFSDYMEVDSRGRYNINHLPAENDPILGRVRRIRVRDQMFVDRLQDFYGEFDRNMTASYDNWRLESYAETENLRELKSQALARTVGGALAVIGGILAQGSSSATARSAGILGIGAGAYMFKSGLDKNAEARIHTEALKELAESLNAEIQPQTIALTDRTIELSGTVDEQYHEWQALLHQIYLIETGQTSSDVITN